MDAPEIFCRAARAQHRSRIRTCAAEDRWLLTRVAEELRDRWADQHKPAARALILGDDGDAIVPALRAAGTTCIRADVSGPWADVQCDEDRLPFAAASFDVVFACATLDSVNDLPGALILIRRSLRLGGTFLGVFLGAGSGEHLRAALNSSTGAGRTIARTHPLIDVRAAGDLLSRAGFSEPVADAETITVRYAAISTALADRRANALGNCLKDRHSVSRRDIGEWQMRVRSLSDGEAAYEENYRPVYVTGRAPT